MTCPAVVTISNELGDPRYPAAAAKIKARKKKPSVVSAADLGVTSEQLTPRVGLSRQFVPEVQGNCELLQGDDPAALAKQLIERLRADSII